VGMASLCNVELRLGLCDKADDEAELSEVDTVSGVKVHYVNNGLKVAPSNRERALLCENDNDGEVACCASQVGPTTYRFATGEHVCRLLRLMHSKKAGGRVRTIGTPCGHASALVPRAH
jgi:hypothetical protein